MIAAKTYFTGDAWFDGLVVACVHNLYLLMGEVSAYRFRAVLQGVVRFGEMCQGEASVSP